MPWVTAVPGGLDDLKWGYTLTDVYRITNAAVQSVGSYAADRRWLAEEAWSAIVEYLYAAEQPPPEHDMWHAGRRAIWDAIRSDQRTHGAASHTNFEPEAMLGFQRYWWAYSSRQHSHEDQVVDRVALRQVLSRLTAGQRSALFALAATGTVERAALALGRTPNAVNVAIVTGRRVVAEMFMEGETPRRTVWRTAGTTRRRKAVASNQGGHCRRGHPFDEENTYERSNGARACRRCIADARGRLQRKKRAASRVAVGEHPRGGDS